jgi:enoyl-CoA hydratase/carnithine racemase
MIMIVTKKFDCVDYEEDGQIAIIRMNNNERRNSLNLPMRRGLNGAFGQFEENDNIRVAILTGVGNTFCSGQDTKDMVGLSEEERQKNAEEMKKLSRTGAFEHRDRIPKPIIAAVNGWAIGYGWFVAMGCDLVVAAESAIFWQNEPLFGFQGGGQAIATQMLPFHLGVEIALAAKMTAQRCYEIGLVNKVVPDDQLIPAAREMAQGICELAPLSVRIIVEACRSARLSSAVPSSIALARWQEFNYLPNTEDVREGFRAFAEKRKPVWKGK